MTPEQDARTTSTRCPHCARPVAPITLPVTTGEACDLCYAPLTDEELRCRGAGHTTVRSRRPQFSRVDHRVASGSAATPCGSHPSSRPTPAMTCSPAATATGWRGTGSSLYTYRPRREHQAYAGCLLGVSGPHPAGPPVSEGATS